MATGIVAGVALTVVEISKRSSIESKRLQGTADINGLGGVAAVINRDPATWISSYKGQPVASGQTATVGNCLNSNSSGPWVCPAVIAPTLVTDRILRSEMGATDLTPPTRSISYIDLYDYNMTRVAGTGDPNGSSPDNPVYFREDGTQCLTNVTTDMTCRYRAIGYMIRDNAVTTTTGPGMVDFIRVLETSPYVLGKGVPAPPAVYEKISIGLSWKNTNDNVLPVGSILAYGGDAAPAGFLEADGSELSATTYPQLYAALGCAWGCGAGTFRLPDLRGFFLRGSSSTSPGSGSVSTVSTLGPHTHTGIAFSPTGFGFSGAPASVTVPTRTVPVNATATLSIYPAAAFYYAGSGPFSGWSSPLRMANANVGGGHVIHGTGSGSVSFTRSLNFRFEADAVPPQSETRPRNLAVRYLIRVDYD